MLNPVSHFTVPGFFDGAKQMRAEFDRRFDPKASFKNTGQRFVWDYWHVPEQYTLLRTPALSFFSKKITQGFHESLAEWGRQNLGCHQITPTWLSCYVDGCEQKTHSDHPHGPWAFVFSLTNWNRRAFKGGETFLLKDEVLDYWRGMHSRKSIELGGVENLIPAKFNQLTVFDPRIPHGVKKVQGPGVHDVRDGRLVIHGWFTDPRPLVDGPASISEFNERVGELLHSFGKIPEIASMQGIASFKFKIAASGQVTEVNVLPHTLRSAEYDSKAMGGVLRHIVGKISHWEFSKKKSGTQITLPLSFTT